VALAATLGGCKAPADLAGLPVYDEGFQRTYFEAQNHLAKGDLDLAYTSFLACLDMQPEERALHFDLAKIDLQREQYESAVNHLNPVLDADADHRWAHEYRAEALLALGDTEAALEDLVWVVQARPGNLDWIYDWSMQLADAGEPAAALALCDAYEAETPGDPDVRLQRFYFLELLNDYETIYHGLEGAVVEFPDIAEFKLQWAQMLRATGQDDAALAALLEVVEDDPSNGVAQLDLAHLYTALNEIRLAQEALLIAFASQDVFIEEKREILAQYLQIAAVDPSLNPMVEALLEAALGQHPKSAELHMLAADYEQGQGRLEAAIVHSEVAIEANPADPLGWTNLIALDADLDHAADMLSHATQAALDQGDFTTVVNVLERGLGVILDAPEMEGLMHSMLGDALHQTGDPSRAFAAYEKSLERLPDNPGVLNNYAYYLAEADENLPRALELSIRLMELAPMEPNFMDTHAWTLYKNGRYPEALDFITQALFQSENQGPEFWEHDGDIRLAMGDTSGALASWQRAVEAGGDADVLNTKIQAHQ
jgi:tetratricopeptide (TPR) repeat protein